MNYKHFIENVFDRFHSVDRHFRSSPERFKQIKFFYEFNCVCVDSFSYFDKKQSAIGNVKETLTFIFNEHFRSFVSYPETKKKKKTGVPGKSHKQQRLEQPNSGIIDLSM